MCRCGPIAAPLSRCQSFLSSDAISHCTQLSGTRGCQGVGARYMMRAGLVLGTKIFRSCWTS